MLWGKPCPNCVQDHCLNARFGCDESSQVWRRCDVSRSFESDSGLASTERCLYHAVLRETREEPFERPVPNLVIDFCSPLFRKECVAVNSQDVVRAADSQILSGAFVHCSNDVCFAQELLRDVLSWSDSDSKCDASSGNCGDFGHIPYVTNSPLGRRCIQVVHVVDDLRLQRVPLRSDFGVGDIEFPQEGTRIG